MSPVVRNILAVIIGLVVGNLVNMFLITYSGSIIPLPEGIDPNNMEQLQENFKHFPLKNFIMPFLAHALGTLAAAYVACKLAMSRKRTLVIIIGSIFLVGGIAASFMIKPPSWFIFVDLALAYFPMAFLGQKLAGDKSWISNKS